MPLFLYFCKNNLYILFTQEKNQYKINVETFFTGKLI